MIELVVLDFETTGVDVYTDRIVTAYAGLLDANGELVRSQEWIVNPGIDIPEGASDVHGWTTERLAAEPRARRDADAVTLEIAHLIWNLCGAEDGPRYPLAGFNLAYDLTMLKAHLERAGTVMFPFGPQAVRVLDGIVLDKHYDKWVKGTGQRKLTPTAARYGIELTEAQAHDASFDAIAAGRICQAIVARHARNGNINALHQQQIQWRAEQQRSLQQWLNTKGGEPDAICEPGWPVQ